MDRFLERRTNVRNGNHILPLHSGREHPARERFKRIGLLRLHPILLFSSILFMLLGTSLSGSIANGIGFPTHSTEVLLLVIIIGIDALTAVPMARLRQQGRAWRFASINIISVVVNVVLNLFIFLYCMKKYNAGETNAVIDAVYDPSFGVGYVFLIKLIQYRK